MTQEYLQECRREKLAMADMEQRITELRHRIENPRRSSLSLPRGGKQEEHAIDDMLHKLAELEQQHDAMFFSLIDKQRTIERAVWKLPDSLERVVIGYRYVDGLKWDEISKLIDCSKNTTHVLHRNAIAGLALQP